MSAFAISALERGHRRRPQLKTVALLADALALDVEQRSEFETAARSAPRPSNGAVTVGPWMGDAATADAPNNLPRQVTPLIGRDDDIAKIVPMTREHALVTLIGAGGVGKTRLALAVGEAVLGDAGDGVWLVELAPLRDAASPLQRIASAFALSERDPDRLLDVLLKYLQPRSLALIIDNCEHLIDETARILDAIVHTAPDVRILATSREPLRIAAEHVYRVPSLAVPSSATPTALEARRYSAIALFVERATAAEATFSLDDVNAGPVAEICRRLDGIPLAIELAAARTRVLSATEIEEKLRERLSVLGIAGRTSIPRQQTLRALIGWSYDLLSEAEAKLFRSLGVFAGDFALDSVVGVHEGGGEDSAFDLLASLVDKSLVQAETTAEKTRFRLLESVRAYAHEQLIARGELDDASSAHAQTYLALARRLETEWEDTPDIEWRARAKPELENWRAALRWAFADGRHDSAGPRLVAALRPVWFTLSPAEGLTLTRMALERCGDSIADVVRAWLELSAAHLSMVAQQYRDAAAFAQRAFADFSELGERKGVALARLFTGAARAMLGEAEQARIDLRATLEECSALGARRQVAAAFIYLAALELGCGDADAARSLFVEALTLFKELGASRPAAHVALNLAELEFKSGNAEEALRLANEALEADGALNDPDAVVYDLCNVAAYEVALSRWEAAGVHAGDALVLARERGMTSAAVWATQHLAAIAALRLVSDPALASEQRARAAQLVGYVDARLAEYGLHRDFTEQREYERILAAIREKLGPNIEALLQDGRLWDDVRALEESLLV